MWLKFFEKFNLSVRLGLYSKSEELKFNLDINDQDIKQLQVILKEKNIACFVYKLSTNLYHFEFDSVPTINYNSNSPEFDSNCEDDEVANFTSEEEKKIYLANSELFIVDGLKTHLYNNHDALVTSIQDELKLVKSRYSNLVGRTIRATIPFDINSQNELDVLSITVPIADINGYYLEFLDLMKIQNGYLIKFKLEAYNLQVQKRRSPTIIS